MIPKRRDTGDEERDNMDFTDAFLFQPQAQRDWQLEKKEGIKRWRDEFS
jgi:hypothetical protein